MQDGSSSRFVGREPERKALDAALGAAVDGRPSVVLIGGDAGIGKSRLLRELAPATAAAGGAFALGGCVDFADAPLPYRPVAELLRSLTRSAPAHRLAPLLDPVRPELARLVPELARAGDAGELPVPAGDELSRGRLFDAVRSVLEGLAEDGPVVVAVEDLHWADLSTLDLLAFLVTNLTGGIVLVATYRSDALPRGHHLRGYVAELARHPVVVRLDLLPLTRDELAAQITGIQGRRPAPDLLDLVWTRSEGNPFFAEELLAATSGTLSPTLADLLASRLQEVSSATQEVVRLVAAGGRQVSHELLIAVSGLPEDDLVVALREAVAHNLLVATGEAYAFRHALLREAAYGELLPGERARVHGRYGVALERDPARGESGTRVTAELARHWRAAGQATKALPASIAAATEAEAACGFAEAHRHLGHAIAALDSAPDVTEAGGVDLLGLLGRAAEDAHLAGEHGAACALTRRAIGLAAAPNDGSPHDWATVRVGLLHERLGCYLWAGGESALALDAHAEAVRLVPDAPTPQRACVLVAEARARMLAAQHGEARALAEQAIEVARLAGSEPERGQAQAVLGFSRSVLGEPEEGLALLRDALQVAEDSADPAGTVFASKYLALVLSGPLARLDEAYEVVRAGLDRARRLGLERDYGVSLRAIAADTLFRSGRWDEAEGFVEEALESQPTGAAAIDLHLARAKLAIGRARFAEAAGDLEAASALAANAIDAPFQAPLCTLRAGLALWEDRFDDARAAVEEGRAWLHATDDLWLLGPLLWHGLRVEAEDAARLRAQRDRTGVEGCATRARSLMADAAAMGEAGAGGGVLQRVVRAYVHMCAAEVARIEGTPDPAPSAAAAELWTSLGQPYPAAYADWRHAEARLEQGDRSAATTAVLRRAHAAAVRIGAPRLVADVEDLARRAHVALDEPAVAPPADDAPPPPVDAFGLTRREREVLGLVSAGWTNREIGEGLFISEKTASVHVSRILTKLGVRSRVEAAGLGHRLGLSGTAGR